MIILFFTDVSNSGSGTAHADELGYLFKTWRDPEMLAAATEADLCTVERMVKLWTNFAKTG